MKFNVNSFAMQFFNGTIPHPEIPPEMYITGLEEVNTIEDFHRCLRKYNFFGFDLDIPVNVDHKELIMTCLENYSIDMYRYHLDNYVTFTPSDYPILYQHRNLLTNPKYERMFFFAPNKTSFMTPEDLKLFNSDLIDHNGNLKDIFSISWGSLIQALLDFKCHHKISAAWVSVPLNGGGAHLACNYVEITSTHLIYDRCENWVNHYILTPINRKYYAELIGNPK